MGPEGEVVEFQLSGLDYGTHQGYVQIAAPDGLAIDNTRFFTLDVAPARRILVAAENRRDAVFLVELWAGTAGLRRWVAFRMRRRTL